MLQENGPFTITPGEERFTLNEHAWNKRAGVVYFEGPAGVGYSESLSN
jgi:carboxypeptidase C (cathepsin A)